jgi:hypothetical protein
MLTWSSEVTEHTPKDEALCVREILEQIVSDRLDDLWLGRFR